MKRTKYLCLVNYSQEIYRSVFENNGKYFIRYNNMVMDVTCMKKWFVQRW